MAALETTYYWLIPFERKERIMMSGYENDYVGILRIKTVCTARHAC